MILVLLWVGLLSQFITDTRKFHDLLIAAAPTAKKPPPLLPFFG
jgi:hypothetical protein